MTNHDTFVQFYRQITGFLDEQYNMTDLHTADDLERLALINDLRLAADREYFAHIDALVQEAKRAGRTWAQIGAALKCTRQNAQQSYGRDE